MTQDLSDLRNITPEIENQLHGIGIASSREFLKIGGKKAYLQLTATGVQPNDELRCRLLGAEQDLDWQIVAARDKRRAKSRFADVDEP